MKKIKVQLIRTGKLGQEIYVRDPKGGYTCFLKDFSNIISEGKTISAAQKNLWNTVYDVLNHLMIRTGKFDKNKL
jgi:hypothetical protein